MNAKYRLVQFGDDTWGVMQRSGTRTCMYVSPRPGGLSAYSSDATRMTHAAAKAMADKMNGVIGKQLSFTDFTRATAHVPMTEAMREALRLLLVDGRSWTQAAARAGVTVSGISRALARVKQANATA